VAPPRPHLLVVDDLTDAADSMTLLLTLWGYDAESRYCGESALVAAAARRPQAILLDVGMPKMSGFEFIARFRELPGGVATTIIVVSGHTDATTRTRARQMGIAHYLIKPADPSEVRSLLETLTRWGSSVGGIPQEWAVRPPCATAARAMRGAPTGLARPNFSHPNCRRRTPSTHHAHPVRDTADTLLPHTANDHSPTCE